MVTRSWFLYGMKRPREDVIHKKDVFKVIPELPYSLPGRHVAFANVKLVFITENS